MRYQAVMFDLDGTLADTLRDIADAANHALAQLGRPTFPVPKYRYLVGQGARWLMTTALGPGHADLVERGLALFRAHYALHGLDHTGPYSGIAELLDELSRQELKLAVLSNKPDSAVRAMMAGVFSRWRFDAASGEIEGGPLKPNPAAALRIATRLGIEPAAWLYVGDTSVDMLTAVAAGMFPVGVLWGFRDEPELRESGAKVIIRQPLELLDLL
jgi:phosphoglycolate phosphatase